MLGEPTGVYLPDTTLNRMIHFAQHETMLALKEKTSAVCTTLVTTPSTTRYIISKTTDTVLTSVVSLVLYKDMTAAGGEERALSYVPPELIGQIGSGESPAHYTVVGRYLVLGKSPIGSDTLYVCMSRVPRDLSAIGTLLTVAKEDQSAVAFYAAMLASLRDKQVATAQLYWQMWQAHVGMKGYAVPPEQGVGGQ
jgi:hypothetical protein